MLIITHCSSIERISPKKLTVFVFYKFDQFGILYSGDFSQREKSTRICDVFGTSGELVRFNDRVSNYSTHSRFRLSERHRSRMTHELEESSSSPLLNRARYVTLNVSHDLFFFFFFLTFVLTKQRQSARLRISRDPFDVFSRKPKFLEPRTRRRPTFGSIAKRIRESNVCVPRKEKKQSRMPRYARIL